VSARTSAEPDPVARRRVGAGFTLVELLVSMAVLALVALTMMGGLRFVLQALASTDGRREALEELTLGLAVLRGELERAEPLMLKVGQQDFVLFEGTPERLRFANVEPPYLAGAPYLVHEYGIVPEGGGTYRVEVRRAPLDPASPDLAVVQEALPRTVLRVGPPLRFTYFGQLRERDPRGWHEEWPRGPRLPEAIRLAEGDEPSWPELVVPLRITVPWYCGVADPPSSAGCAATPESEAPGGLQPEGALGDPEREAPAPERPGIGEARS
jgi:prepilin-type N-terminal cleavage/methylation domain-containing protein